MGRLRVLSGQEVCAILANHGFEEVRRRGSHFIMQKKVPQSTITVPVSDYSKYNFSQVVTKIIEDKLGPERG